MAGNASSYLRNNLLDHSLGTAAYTMPSAVYLAAYVGDPGETGVEVSTLDTGYARQAVTFAGASAGSAASNAEVAFPVATANWGTVSHLALFDAQSGGNLLWYGPMATAKTIEVNDQLKVASANFTVSLS